MTRVRDGEVRVRFGEKESRVLNAGLVVGTVEKARFRRDFSESDGRRGARTVLVGACSVSWKDSSEE